MALLNVLIRIFFLFFLLLPGTLTRAQAPFEGTLSFSVELSGQDAERLKVNEPNNKLTMHMKEGNYIVLLQGGMYPKTMMFLADSNYEYSIDQANQRAFRFSSYSEKNENFARPVATPTGKTATVLGMVCQEYQMKSDGSEFLFYVNDAYRANVKAFPPKARTKASFLIQGLDGRIPLKTIKKDPTITVTTTVVKITPRTFEASQFLIPEGFEVKNRDYRF
jgi:hypothetical protein